MTRLRESLGTKLKKNITQIMLLIETVIIFGIFQILTKGTYLTARNLTNIMMQGCVYSIMGIGILFIMVSGNMDLSGGSVLGFLSAMGAVMQMKGASTAVTFLAMLAAGALIGVWQGYWVAYRGLPSFIVTLAGMLLFRGLCLLVGGGGTVGPVSESFGAIGSAYLPTITDAPIHDTTLILIVAAMLIAIVMMIRGRKNKQKFNLPVESKGSFISKIILTVAALLLVYLILNAYRGLPYALLLLAILGCVFTYVAKNTTFGRYIFAIGGNSEATRLAGINVKKMIFLNYILMGVMVAVASIVYLGRVGQATASAGKDFEFSAITGCIVGGVSTMGGIGSIPYAILGTILMQGIDNGMSLLNLGSMVQYIVRGLVLLFAVAIDVATKKKSN